jgi:hypothetical protein
MKARRGETLWWLDAKHDSATGIAEDAQAL